MKGLDYDKLFPGRFVKAGDLDGKDRTLTIANVRIEELPQDQGGKKVKGIISFEGAKKELVLNRTNGECFKALWGRDTGDWIGKRVTLCVAQWNGEPCIRIRGSPDIEKTMDIEIKLPRRKPLRWKLLKTGSAEKANGKSAPSTEPPPEEAPPTPGEPETDGADIAF